MSYRPGYDLIRPPVTLYQNTEPQEDKMAPVTTMNRIAKVACERILLMMNNTQMVKERRLTNMDQVLTYLTGMHDDVGLSGDRGDFYRRRLAHEMFTCYAVHGVDHNNVVVVVEAAIALETETRQIIERNAINRNSAPIVNMDKEILKILSRIADIC